MKNTLYEYVQNTAKQNKANLTKGTVLLVHNTDNNDYRFIVIEYLGNDAYKLVNTQDIDIWAKKDEIVTFYIMKDNDKLVSIEWPDCDIEIIKEGSLC